MLEQDESSALDDGILDKSIKVSSHRIRPSYKYDSIYRIMSLQKQLYELRLSIKEEVARGECGHQRLYPIMQNVFLKFMILENQIPHVSIPT